MGDIEYKHAAAFGAGLIKCVSGRTKGHRCKRKLTVPKLPTDALIGWKQPTKIGERVSEPTRMLNPSCSRGSEKRANERGLRFT